MNTNLHFSSKTNEWETPKDLFLKLDEEFHFSLDSAATKENALCKEYYTMEDDSLLKDWSKHGVIWCNPPYGRLIGKFVEKAYKESQKGCIVVMLIPARVDTKWWHAYCSKAEVRFLKGRLKFVNRMLPSYRSDGNFNISPAPFPSAIVVFKKDVKPSTMYVCK